MLWLVDRFMLGRPGWIRREVKGVVYVCVSASEKEQREAWSEAVMSGIQNEPDQPGLPKEKVPTES